MTLHILDFDHIVGSAWSSPPEGVHVRIYRPDRQRWWNRTLADALLAGSTIRVPIVGPVIRFLPVTAAGLPCCLADLSGHPALFTIHSDILRLGRG